MVTAKSYKFLRLGKNPCQLVNIHTTRLYFIHYLLEALYSLTISKFLVHNIH